MAYNKILLHVTLAERMEHVKIDKETPLDEPSPLIETKKRRVGVITIVSCTIVTLNIALYLYTREK